MMEGITKIGIML